MDPSAPVFKCVPLDNAWTIPGTKLDLKAIYRRPARVVGEFDEVRQAVGADGMPLYDITGPLPLRRHSDWLAKGYEYVTLADMKSLEDVAPSLRQRGLSPAEFLQHPVFGPWNPKLYLASQGKVDQEKFAQLVAHVRKVGVEAYEDITGKKVPEVVRQMLAAEGAPGTVASTAAGELGEKSAPPAPAKKPHWRTRKDAAAKKAAEAAEVQS